VKRSNTVVYKTTGIRLRGFESLSQHHINMKPFNEIDEKLTPLLESQAKEIFLLGTLSRVDRAIDIVEGIPVSLSSSYKDVNYVYLGLCYVASSGKPKTKIVSIGEQSSIKGHIPRYPFLPIDVKLIYELNRQTYQFCQDNGVNYDEQFGI
jgi:hypothetical protein